MTDWASECAMRWILKHADGVYSAQEAIEEAVREAIAKAAESVVCECKDAVCSCATLTVGSIRKLGESK